MMKIQWQSHSVSFAAGLIFAAGLGIAGMTQPGKIISFLNISGNWDPSMAVVMAGAIAVHALAYHLWLKHRRRPLLETAFSLPTKQTIDTRLLLGAALFGIGWGLSGYCPGPALVSAMSLSVTALVFSGSMLAGMLLFRIRS